jgi:hypothetical protein
MIKFKSILNTSLKYILRENSFTLGDDDLELAKDFNVTYLTIGDQITPDMWNLDIDMIELSPYRWKQVYSKIWNIITLTRSGNIEMKSTKGNYVVFSPDFLNQYLKPEFKIEVPLDESFELGAGDLELAKDFGKKFLKVGDTIMPDMVNDSGIMRYPGHRSDATWNNLTSKYPLKIVNIMGDQEDIVVLADPQNPREIQYKLLDTLNNHYLKPPYKITNNELDETFELGADDLELAKNFNIKYLTQGDTIKPEMWDPSKIKNILYTDIDFNEPYKITGHALDDNWDEEGYYTDVFLTDSWDDEIYEVLDNINMWLKPQFQVEVESLDESFELGAGDLELAKDFGVYELGVGDTITPDMWDRKKAIKEFDWWDDEERKWLDLPWEILQFTEVGNVRFAINNEFVRMFGLDFINKVLKPKFQLANNELDETFELGADDLELAKDFSPNEVFLTVGDTIEPEMVYDSGITDHGRNGFSSWENLASEMPLKIVDVIGDKKDLVVLANPQNPNKLTHWTVDSLNNHYLKPKYYFEVPLNESFELGDEDLELAKDFSPNPDIQIDVHVIYDFGGSQEELKHETTFRFLFKIPDLIEFIDENGYENITEGDIINNLDSEWLDDLILDTMNYHSSNHSELDKDTIWNNDTWLEENCSKILNPVDWSKIPYGTEIKKRELELSIDLLDPSKKVNEEFTLGDEDMELAKDFNKRELKVGDYFYESSNPEYAGAWTKLEDAPSLIRNFVQKIIYIGPNEGQYKEPSYYDDDIVAFEFAIDPQNVYTLTVNYFNRDFSDKINAYIPTKNTLYEDFELTADDLELAKGLNVKKLTVGDIITPDMWDFDFITTPIEIIRITNVKVKVLFPTGYTNSFNIDDLNTDYLKPEFQIKKGSSNGPIGETFEMGPEDIGLANGLKVIKYLEVGNQITPNMWNPNNPDLEDFINNRNESWIISMIEDNYIYLNTESGNEINTDIETFNSLLKPEYMIESNIYNK